MSDHGSIRPQPNPGHENTLFTTNGEEDEADKMAVVDSPGEAITADSPGGGEQAEDGEDDWIPSAQNEKCVQHFLVLAQDDTGRWSQ